VGRLVCNELQQHEAQAAVAEHACAATATAAVLSAPAGKAVFMFAAGGAAVVMAGMEMSHGEHPS